MSATNGFVNRDKWRQHSGVTRYEDVDVEGFGKIRARNLSYGETCDIVGRAEDLEPRYAFADRMIAQVVDPENDNAPMFGEMDREWLADVEFAVAGKVFVELRRINEEMATVDELKKK